MEVIICEKYKLGRKIGSGSFGDIYLGVNKKTNEESKTNVLQQM